MNPMQNLTHMTTGVETLTPSLTEHDRRLIDEKARLLADDIRKDIFGSNHPRADWQRVFERLRVTAYEEISTLAALIVELHHDHESHQ